jgi:diadenosine tetraphosphate (Ap4A) HIT family hydrolase
MTSPSDQSAPNVLKEYSNWTLLLDPNQTYLGSTYAQLNREGELDPFQDTTTAERRELMVVMRGVHRCIDELWLPDSYNYSAYYSGQHLEWHIKPRYQNPRALEGELFIDPYRGDGEAPYNREFYITASTFAVIRNEIVKRLK